MQVVPSPGLRGDLLLCDCTRFLRQCGRRPKMPVDLEAIRFGVIFKQQQRQKRVGTVGRKDARLAQVAVKIIKKTGPRFCQQPARGLRRRHADRLHFQPGHQPVRGIPAPERDEAFDSHSLTSATDQVDRKASRARIATHIVVQNHLRLSRSQRQRVCQFAQIGQYGQHANGDCPCRLPSSTSVRTRPDW